MKLDHMGPDRQVHTLCHYEPSRLPFRGPRQDLTGDYVAVLGGSDTFGRFIKTPYAERLSHAVGMPCVNLGCVNAGIDAFYKDRTVIDICRNANAIIIQALGAQNMSNRFYTVHPRRNDRFLRASQGLQNLYPEIDFAEFIFTRHLLTELFRADAQRFTLVEEELRSAWVPRLRSLIEATGRPVILFWFADHYPDEAITDHPRGPMQAEPLFVTRRMLDALRDDVTSIVELRPSQRILDQGTAGMVFGPDQAAAAAELMGVGAHQQAAEALSTPLRQALVGAQKNGPVLVDRPANCSIPTDQSLSVSSGTAWNRSATRP